MSLSGFEERESIALQYDAIDLHDGSQKMRTTLLNILFALLLVSVVCYAQEPPKEAGPFRKPELVELRKLDSSIRLDIRYATSNNFLGRPVYTEARAFLQRPAAQSLVRANR